MAEVEKRSLISVPIFSWFGGWLNWTGLWNNFNEDMLRTAEKKILGLLTIPYRGRYVEIQGVVDAHDKIWTISMNEESNKTPLVLIHGLASGSALWCLNLDSFAANRPVHAVDIIGFARSSRPTFSNDAKEAERQLVDSIEAWRREMNLENMIIMGHSMGGFLASSYAIKYPDRVKHLILADPWGFPPRPDDPAQGRQIPLWAKPGVYIAQKFYPLSPLRLMGPLGQWMISKLRPDLIRHFVPFLKEDSNMIPQYIHQCNIQRPSGEMAFKAMSAYFGWAKFPMIDRIDTLRTDVPLTVIYGGRSWVDNSSGEVIKSKRPAGSFVNVVTIQGAGHHLYAEKKDIFNDTVNEACDLVD